MLKTTRPALRMLAFGYDVFTSSGLRHWAWLTMSIHARDCDRAALIPLWPAWLAKKLSASPVPITIISPKWHKVPKIGSVMYVTIRTGIFRLARKDTRHHPLDICLP